MSDPGIIPSAPETVTSHDILRNYLVGSVESGDLKVPNLARFARMLVNVPLVEIPAIERLKIARDPANVDEPSDPNSLIIIYLDQAYTRAVDPANVSKTMGYTWVNRNIATRRKIEGLISSGISKQELKLISQNFIDDGLNVNVSKIQEADARADIDNKIIQFAKDKMGIVLDRNYYHDIRRFATLLSVAIPNYLLGQELADFIESYTPGVLI